MLSVTQDKWGGVLPSCWVMAWPGGSTRFAVVAGYVVSVVRRPYVCVRAVLGNQARGWFLPVEAAIACKVLGFTEDSRHLGSVVVRLMCAVGERMKEYFHGLLALRSVAKL